MTDALPEFMRNTSELTIIPDETALLIIDVQNYTCHRDGEIFKGLTEEQFNTQWGEYWNMLHNKAVPNIKRLLSACREKKIEVIYSTIESLTSDGRDNCPQYKKLNINVPKGSWAGKIIDEIEPQGDEIVIRKSSSSVFMSSSINYVLRNIGIKHLLICGIVTDQCVESAIRDATDLGYTITQLPDACAAISEDMHNASIASIAVYCDHQVDTDTAVDTLSKL